MSDASARIGALKRKIEAFNEARNWHRWHKPKNIAMSILIEAAELAEHFQWTDHEDAKKFDQAKWREIEAELADVLIYCFVFANRCGIDVSNAVLRKMRQNAQKYPTRLFNKQRLADAEIIQRTYRDLGRRSRKVTRS